MSNKNIFSLRGKIFKYILILIIFLLIISYVFELANFVNKYNNSYYLGKTLKKVCEDEFVEAEGHRMHIAKNEKELKELIYEKSNYIQLTIIILVIIAFIISGIFASLCVELFYNEKFINDILNNTTIDSKNAFSKLLNFMLPTTILNIVMSSIKLLFTSYKPKEMYQNISLFLYILIAVFCILFIGFIYPVTQLLNSNIFSIFYSVPEMTFNSFYVNNIFALAILLRTVYFFVSPKNDSNFSKYFTENPVFHKQNLFTFLQFVLILYIYVFIFTAISALKDKKPTDKEPHEDRVKSLIELFMRIWGVSKNSKFSTFIFNLLIISVVIYSLLLFTPKHLSGSVQVLNDYVLPLIMFVLFISVTINTMIEYNKTISEDILNKPINLYKKHLDSINTEFNQVLDYENEHYLDNKNSTNICTNVANAISMILYSHLLKGINGLSSSSNGAEKSSEIHLIPKFKYSKTCEKTVYKYYEDDLYNILYILGVKGKGQNILFNSDKCDSPNINVIQKLKSNTSTIPVDIIKKKMKTAIQNVLNFKLYYNQSTRFILTSGDDLNNKMVDIENIQDIKHDVEKYNVTIDKVVKEYSKLDELISDDLFKIFKSQDYDQINKKIESIVLKISNTFHEINKIMSQEYDSNRSAKITNYIISNYNNIHKDDMYPNNYLIKTSNKITKKWDLKSIEDMLDTSSKICQNLVLEDSEKIKSKIDIYLFHGNSIDSFVKSRLFQNSITIKYDNTYSTNSFREIIDSIQKWIDNPDTSMRPLSKIRDMQKDIAEIRTSIDLYKMNLQDDIETNMVKQDSMIIHRNAQQTDKMIYFVALNYIVIMTIVHFII
jgi:hypothetical protein